MEQLLTTKLFIPPIRLKLVSRPRLVERINDGIHRKLTLISAPAGFGKTTLVSEWVEQSRSDDQNTHSFAWLSLDETDNNLVQFLSYFITALSQTNCIDTVTAKSVLGMLQSPQSPPIETVLTPPINEIAAIPNQITLILDDYHLIRVQPIHDALTFWLENQPPQMHLMITTRVDPPLPLARLRAKNQLAELRALDLRFSQAEAAEFLNQAMDLNLSTENITALENRTEGWIAGLQLAAISLKRHEDISELIRSFTGSDRLVLDYLIEEVLSQQTKSVQTFLLQTSILNRLSASLCDAITGQDNGQETLEMLERANLFIVPLDNERQWYRYHHLFTDVLKARLAGQQPDQVAILHLRASEWYEGENISSEAIHHALAADDFERAADLAELAWPAWRDASQSIVWFGWVRTLPDELVRARPVLSVAFAQAHLIAGKLEAAVARLVDAERWLESIADMRTPQDVTTSKMVFVNEEQFRDLPISVALARAHLAQTIGDVPGTMQYAQQALDTLPEGAHPLREHAITLLGLAYWASGDTEAAHKNFSDGLMIGTIYAMIHGAYVLADMEMTLGHLKEALSTCERALQLAAEHGDPMSLGAAEVYICMSNLHRERGDLETAAQDLARSKMLGEQVELQDWQYRWCVAQSRLMQSQRFLDEALVLLDEAERLYIRTAVHEVRPIAARKARVWVTQGRLAEALGWARERGLSVDDELSFLQEFEHITLARVLLACYKHYQEENYIFDAIKLIGKLVKATEKAGRTGNTIEILVLQALALQAQSDIPSALSSLEKALTLAEPEGYCRIFADEGAPMEALIKKFKAEDGKMKEYVRTLLAAFSDSAIHPSAIRDQPLIEPLSEREIEVLHLLAEGLTNREIADRLFLSLNTIKVYNRNINSKLDVNSRTKAVVKAKAFGILPSD